MAKDKSKTGWGGKWTEQKLLAFEKYVKAYLDIMNVHRNKYSVKWKLIYLDAFAGSGSRETESLLERQQWLADFDIEPNEFSVYKGAAERVLAIGRNDFDHYYFVDRDEKASAKLQKKLLGGNTDDPRLQFRPGDANDYIKKLGNHLQKNKHYKALVLLDPFGMQINWEALTHLQGTSTDLWILVPSGMIISRLLKKDGTLKYPKRLSDYFGLSEQEILTRFYSEKTEKTFFGDETKLSKVEKPTRRIAETYVERLRDIFTHVVTEPMVLRNSRGVPIYHFVFASNNPTAKKIAKDIIGKDSQ
jgi:three-Cys-motif partner protein